MGETHGKLVHFFINATGNFNNLFKIKKEPIRGRFGIRPARAFKLLIRRNEKIPIRNEK